MPFKARGSGIATVTGAFGPFVYLTINAAGEATHLGQWTMTGTMQIDFSKSPATTTGFGTWTAANGDLLCTTSVGTYDTITRCRKGSFMCHYLDLTHRWP